ncbi:MAG TPA: PilN domain-containing protein [Vicinamibacterales bacterium]|nr:PilN domain-containing protein [Vicinamibacterales bacterium]
MIRINLLATERKVARKKAAFDPSRQITVVCAAILLAAGLAVGWRFWTITTDARQVDDAIATAQKETQRLHAVIVQVQQFEQRKAQLQQRVTLIEQLRKEQIGPVHMLDQISLALPPSLWLSEMKQTVVPNEVLIDGRSLSLTGLSDFVGNLERSGYFQKSVEIVNSTTDTSGGPQAEVIKFQIKAIFKGPGDVEIARATDTKSAAGQVKPRS